jgi:hypothetical protein
VRKIAMSRQTLTSTVLILLAAAAPASAQESLEGRWEVDRDGSRLQLEHRDRGGRSQMSFGVDADDVRELADGRLELSREAGTFVLTGERSGTFVFTASPDFVQGLESRGYDDPGVRELFSLASLDLALGYLDEMGSLGHGGDLRMLVEMKIHGVDPEYVRAFRELGYEDLSGRQLVEMRIHGVEPEYVREMGVHGYELSARELVEMKVHGVRPEFVREMAELGYRDLSARQLIEMKIHGVSPSFVRRLVEEGYTDLSARELVEMKIHGVPRRGRS